MNLLENNNSLTHTTNMVSFDVFDTIITRNVYHPQDIFLKIQGKLSNIYPNELPEELIHNYRNIRLNAESTARTELAGKEEVTLSEILSVIARRFQLDNTSVDKLKELEIEEELASVVLVDSVANLLWRARDNGYGIIFISDMYLPNNVIRDMLIKVRVFSPGDHLYVSGSIGSKKTSGRLFQHVLNDLKVCTDRIVHIGDYLISDYIAPKFKLGIRSLPVRVARNNMYEHLWGDPCRCLYCSSIAGASRAARVMEATSDDSVIEQVSYRIGCNILGPLLTGFVLWLFREAGRKGIKRLYFLSRDGEVILDAARHLARHFESDIELRYLQVSRTSVFPAMLAAGVNEDSLGWVKEDNIFLTQRIIADRLQLEQEDLQRLITAAGAIKKDLDHNLTVFEVNELFRLMESDPSLASALSSRGQEHLMVLDGYLEQNGLFDGEPSALVDLGWHGSIQDVITTCFGPRLGKNGLSGFYFGVDNPGNDGCRKYGYLFSPGDTNAGERHPHLFRILMELLCAGTHGMVRGHRMNKSRQYEPVYTQIEHPSNLDTAMGIRRGVMSYFRLLATRGFSLADCDHVRPQILTVLQKLFFFPSRGEATVLGNIFFAADQAGHGIRSAAPPFTLQSVMRYFVGSSYAHRSCCSSWFFGSWIRSGLVVKCGLTPIIYGLRLYFLGLATFLTIVKLEFIDYLNSKICKGIKTSKMLRVNSNK